MLLAHRLRRWPNIETALGECPVFGGQVLAMRIFLLQAIYVSDVDAVQWRIQGGRAVGFEPPPPLRKNHHHI